MAKRDDATRLLAIGLLNFADDEGYFYADPSLIRSALRPFDDSSTIIRRGLDELAKIGYIEVRENATHGAIGKVVNFLDHQKIDRPKASPVKGLFDSSIDRRIIDEGSSLYGKGTREQGNKGKEGKGTRDGCALIPADLDTPEFRQAWSAYLAMRIERRFGKLGETTIAARFQEFSEWGLAASIAAIMASVRNGYQGIFNKPQPGNPAAARAGQYPESTELPSL